jgi:hypothetical protein
MKKIIQLTAFYFFTFIFLIACSKKELSVPVSDPLPPVIENPLTGQLFDELNESISRFDPLYLQMVYKDKRTSADIIETGKDLLQQLNAAPDNVSIQRKLIELYHFDSYSDLQKYSNRISFNTSSIKTNLFKNENIFTADQEKMIVAGRHLFLKNKINELSAASKKISNGLWTDNAEWILNQYHYYSLVGNQEMNLGMDEGGGGECEESCCFELKTCSINARNNHLINLFKFSFAGGTSLSLPGAVIGSLVPGIGTAIGYLGATFLGGLGGIMVATEFYNNEIVVCIYNYKACILRKSGN